MKILFAFSIILFCGCKEKQPVLVISYSHGTSFFGHQNFANGDALVINQDTFWVNMITVDKEPPRSIMFWDIPLKQEHHLPFLSDSVVITKASRLDMSDSRKHNEIYHIEDSGYLQIITINGDTLTLDRSKRGAELPMGYSTPIKNKQ